MFDDCIFFNLNSLTRRINEIWDKAFAETGLSASHAYLLGLVLKRPGLRVKAISECLDLAPSTVTRFIDRLEEKGLIDRKPSLEDGRALGIFPTRKARQLAPQLEEIGQELFHEIRSVLGTGEVSTFIRMVRHLTEKL